MKAKRQSPARPRRPDARKETADLGEWAIVALGSNLGDSRQNVLRAMACLRQFSRHPLRKSSLWQTEPVDCPPGSPAFVNAVVAFAPRRGATPEALLTRLRALERAFGRRPKKVMNEPRPLDLDLIAFGRETRASQRLTLPHPRAHLRRFVLQPLSEIAPDLVLPGQAKPVWQLLTELPLDAAPGPEALPVRITQPGGRRAPAAFATCARRAGRTPKSAIRR
ncbi:MAG TPA: 2-amino-4-hydroxy-6-hydroxymethyldihydropteridine diphosphokinase [Verrucomicrobiota bacterium]|jgi:2-amino-4-hydroxy-6-hydroxymethyldihydropteridine diphosphokinase|nr:2-amino-4-hydroxy-6-hydroxymethyldihydropteridine diphosphokinase [Verrucomicrobiota bacterium]HNS68973.1 2-amino-4-hydroxy-6-hydroxymethyldihydropteridine diphosphokinase [Verrucomicrobiota bacterium]